MGLFSQIQKFTYEKGIFQTEKEKVFNQQKNVYDFIVKAGQIPHFKAIKNTEEKSLLIYLDTKKYTFRKNDQIIDRSDISYFIQDIDSNFNLILKVKDKDEDKDKELEIRVQKIKYSEKPMELPSYINTSHINSVININASNSQFGDIGTFLNNQKIDYKSILSDLNNVVENSYHVEELRKMMAEINENINNKEPIKESKLKKFAKFMGTQATELLKLLIAAYATAKLQ